MELIESNWEIIANRSIQAIREHPDLPHLAQQPEGLLREWCRDILENLSYLLLGDKNDEVRRRFEVLGRVRFEENVPLSEAVLRFALLKDRILGFVHEQGLPQTALELYAEEELERRIGRFFDALVYHVVRGYEAALHRAAQLSPVRG